MTWSSRRGCNTYVAYSVLNEGTIRALAEAADLFRKSPERKITLCLAATDHELFETHILPKVINDDLREDNAPVLFIEDSQVVEALQAHGTNNPLSHDLCT